MSDSLAIQRGDTAPPLPPDGLLAFDTAPPLPPEALLALDTTPPLPPEGLLAFDLNPLLERAAALATERMKPVVALAFFLGLALGVAAMILIARWPAVAAALAERAV